ncbi:HEAT repeat domain-containing protein [Micromonospora cathayae]|uniref:HEAT repeat domain-containing protein n=1 Tax=Micromonospora cathayae TaxID=3028804 RepID=A0ABY7ZUJ3_9ACTN|nr:HEAT repeat domain-containing protein [Micromonospora sp. HUAS 3]WDZ86163.1 HEAT repeat domain-containing protein [Micromonospora sp. HUAS 3]
MLDHLDDIDWARLGHAYGSAADVPDQLRALRSPDEKVRKDALGALYANIFHQGTRYEASAYAVPFLLELLADPATPDRDWLLHLLTSLAIGYDESWLPDGVAIAEHRDAAQGGRELLAAKPPPWTDDEDDSDDEDDDSDDGYEDGDKEYVEYAYVESLSEADQGRLWAYIALAGYDAVRAGVPLFRDLLTDPDQGVRVGAAYALAWFPEEAAGSVPALVAAAESGRTPGETATALVAAGLLGAAPDAALLTDPRPVVRWAAAVARARVLGDRTDDATVDELLRWSAVVPEPAGDDDSVPFLGGDLSGYAGTALRHAGPRHADRAFDALLDRLPRVDGKEALRVTAEALRLAFPDGRLPAGTPATALTPAQRRLADTLVGAPGAWLIDGRRFGNFEMLLMEYGLPRDRDELAGYLG